MKFTYSYFKSNSKRPKYGIIAPQRVEALYTEAYDEKDRGIRQLEALPESISEETFYEIYCQKFNGIVDKTASKENQMEQVQRLSDLRLPLEFTRLMEEKLHLLLMKSYRIRAEDYVQKETDITLDGNTIHKQYSCKPSLGGDPDLGLSIIGEGGCGKSTAVKQMLSHYPQVIIHNADGPEADVQIVWIMVTTAGTGSLKETYLQICRAIDVALNTGGLYRRACEKERLLSGMANLVAHLVQIYSIGVIVIDEIQGLAANNQTSAYDTLLQITNTTKCVIMTIGTEAALKTIFKSSHQSRRTGYKIRASDYTRDPDTVKMLISLVMQINWFEDNPEKPFQPTDGMLDHFYRATYGFIERIITLWEEIQCDYIRRKTKPELTVEYFDSIARKLYSKEEQDEKEAEIAANGLFRPSENALILGDSKISTTSKLQKIAQEMLGSNIDLDRQEAIEAFSKTFDPDLALTIYDRVIMNLKERGENFPLYKIKEAVVHSMKYRFAHSGNMSEIVAKTIKYLQTRPKCTMPKIMPLIPNLSKEDFNNIHPTED